MKSVWVLLSAACISGIIQTSEAYAVGLLDPCVATSRALFPPVLEYSCPIIEPCGCGIELPGYVSPYGTYSCGGYPYPFEGCGCGGYPYPYEGCGCGGYPYPYEGCGCGGYPYPYEGCACDCYPYPNEGCGCGLPGYVSIPPLPPVFTGPKFIRQITVPPPYL